MMHMDMGTKAGSCSLEALGKAVPSRSEHMGPFSFNSPPFGGSGDVVRKLVAC